MESPIWQHLPPDLVRHVFRQHFLQRTPPTLADIVPSLEGLQSENECFWGIRLQGDGVVFQVFKHKVNHAVHVVSWRKHPDGECELGNMVIHRYVVKRHVL